MTPAKVEERYGVPPSRYRAKAALVGEASDNLPGVPGVGDKTAAKWITQFGDLDGIIAHVDEIKGKAGESLRAHLADVMRNYELNAPRRRPGPAAHPRRAAVARLGPRGGPPGLRRAGVPDPARPALPVPRRGRAGGRESGFDLAGAVLRDGRGRRLAGRARAGRRPGSASPSPASSAAAPASSPASRSPPPAARPPGSTRPTLDEADERGRRGLARRPDDRPKVIHDAKPALLAFAARGWDLAGRRQRHRARGLPGPARPALLRPRPTWPCATSSASCGSTPPDNGQLTLDGPRRQRRRGRGEPHAARPGHPRPGRRDRRGAAPRRRRLAAAARRGGAAAGRRCSPRWSGPASPPTPTTCPSWRRTSPPR